jgi:hypothetical protein
MSWCDKKYFNVFLNKKHFKKKSLPQYYYLKRYFRVYLFLRLKIVFQKKIFFILN